jgi:hypothetical protein
MGWPIGGGKLKIILTCGPFRIRFYLEFGACGLECI